MHQMRPTGTMLEDLANAVNIPVFTSSLMQVPFVARALWKEKKVGILIASAERARAQNYRLLRSCGIDESAPYVMRGIDESENVDIWRTQFRPGSGYDPKKDEEVMVTEIKKKLVSENLDIGAIVLECTEMPLYAAAVQEATGLPVFDSSTMVKYVYNALVKTHYF